MYTRILVATDGSNIAGQFGGLLFLRSARGSPGK